MSEREQLERAIAALEGQRPILGDEVVETALASLREKLAGYEQTSSPELAVPAEAGRHLASEKSAAPAQAPQGAPAGAALGEQNKQVTVLFADLVGFTSLSEKMDPEDVREILNSYFERWSACIENFGGYIEKFIGDAVMAVFGLQAAHEEDPENAIRAALAMQPELDRLNGTLGKTWGVHLSMRVGIHTGPVIVSFLGERKGQDVVVVGDTVNLASRLQSAAPAGGILISHDTYRHVRGVFDVQTLKPVAVKGKRQPVQVYLVLRAKPRAFRSTTRGVEGIETRTIGRERELKRLQEALTKAMEEGKLQFLTVTGEAGVGKSRLLAEFDNWAELLPQHITYFKGRATAAMQYQANALLRDLFAFRFGIQDSDPPVTVWEKMERGISEIEMAHFIGQLLGFNFTASPYLSGLEGSSAGAARQIRDRALVYLVEFFRALSDRQPVAILLEDLHWADDSSLEIIEQLSSLLAHQPVLILCAARPTLFDRRPNWAQGAPRVHLQPLTPQQSRKLVDEILQKVKRVPEPLRELVVNNSEGNPFYMEELVKMLIEDGVIVKNPGETGEHWEVDLDRLAGVQVPPTLAGVLQARFDSLSPAERRLLQRASVIGRIFWDRAVAALSEEAQMPEPDSLVSGLLSALRSREMIYPRQPSAFEATQEYLFRHALLRDVTYETMLKRERRLYHAYAARWLEEVTELSQRADEYAARIADHYDQAGENGKAADWYLRAGKGAASRFANAEAVRLLSRALELSQPEELALRFQILQAREKVYSLQAERESQVEDQRAMSALADELNDDLLRAQVALRRAILLDVTGEYAQVVEQAERVVRLANQAGDKELEAYGYQVWGTSLYHQAKYQASRELFERALELAQQGQIPGVEADARRTIGIAYEMQSNFPEAGAYLKQALAIYRSINDRRGESACLNSLGVLAFHKGDFATARQHYEMSVRLKREFGDRYSEGITLTNLGIVAHHQGDPEASQRYFEQGLSLSREIGDREGEAADLTGLGSRALYLGDYPTARHYLEQARSICQEIGDRQGESGILSSLGQLESLTGNDRAAEAPCREALRIAREMEGPSEQGYALTYLGQSLFNQGRLDEAWEAYQEAYRIRQSLKLTGLSLDDLAGLAQVELARGEVSQAQVYAQEILDHLLKHEEAGPDETAWVYLVLYQVLLAAGDPRAQVVLESGYAWLQERAARIKDEVSRLSFLDNIPAHRRLAATWEMSNLEE